MAEETTSTVAQDAVPSAEQAGIPQLDFSAFPNQLFWFAVFIILIFLVVKRLAIPRIEGIFEKRRQSIEDDLREAEELNAEAEKLEAEIERLLSDAKKQAGEISAKTRAEIVESQNMAISDANALIASKTSESDARIKAIQSESEEKITEIARELAGEIVESMLPGKGGGESIGSVLKSRIEAR